MGNQNTGPAAAKNEVNTKIAEQFSKFKDPRDGLIKRDKFQEVLSMVDSVGNRKLKDSPLTDLIFDLFAKSNPLSMTEKEFHACAVALAATSPHERTEVTFQALAGSGHDQVSFDAIVQLFERSWRSACRSMIAKRKQRAQAIGGDDFSALIESFCEKNVSLIEDEIRGSLFKNDRSGKGALDRAEFSQWLVLDRTIKVVVDADTVEIPTSLTHQKSAASYPTINAQ